MKKKFVLIIVACIALLCTSCSSSVDEYKSVTSTTISSNIENETATPEPTASTKEKNEKDKKVKKKPKPLSLGKKTTVGNWKFTVKKAEVKSKISNGKYYYFKPSKKKKYVCFTVSAKNTGKKEGTFLPRIGYSNQINVAKLYFGKDEYIATSLLSCDKDLLDKKIKPSASKKGIVVFEVPKKVAKKFKKLKLTIGTDSKFVTYSLK